MGSRQVSGPATELVTGAREALWTMRNNPGISFLCGPKALKNALVARGASRDSIAFLDEVRSGPRGFTLAQVAELASRAGASYRLIQRTSSTQKIPVPSVIHWKLNHYAAIIAYDSRSARYRIQDPTFGAELWLTRAAIEAESSGYFVVLGGATQDPAWKSVDPGSTTAQAVYGMGITAQSQVTSTTPNDTTIHASSPSATPPVLTQKPPCGFGMCVVDALMMLASAKITDAPVGYAPQKGPPVFITLNYNQREASQPAVFSSFNVSPKWSLNVLSYVQDDPTSPGVNVKRLVGGGGSIDYPVAGTGDFDPATGAFPAEKQSTDVLTRIPASGAAIRYELTSRNGQKQVFSASDGSETYPRRFFLTQVVDPAGNALTFRYDSSLRLSSIEDASGRSTAFEYAWATDPLLVTRITDPFGRYAILTYDPNGILATITDAIGITSVFEYDASGILTALTTPYGTTRIQYGSLTTSNRYLEITDPLGLTERLEFSNDAYQIGSETPVPLLAEGLQFHNEFLQYRNTLYWDKHAISSPRVAGMSRVWWDARVTHWLHTPASQTSPVIESTKNPLERRVWYRYPGQSITYFEGTSGRPDAVARVLDDGSTQAEQTRTNPAGNPTRLVDPAGRTQEFEYASNQIDLLTVSQKTSDTEFSVTARYTYNSAHQPLTYSKSSTFPALN